MMNRYRSKPDFAAASIPSLSFCLAIFFAAQPGRGAEVAVPTGDSRPATAAHQVDFAREVLPLLARRCFACHGPDKAEGGLRLNSREGAMAKLDSGEHAIVPSDAAKSEMLRRILSTDADERMPPKDKPLTPEQIALIQAWIQQGAHWGNHWAFQPVRPQTPPAVKNTAWVRNPIDAFVLARLEQRGLAPAAPADKIALLRRAYYDLTGLPPTPAEVDAFLADSSPQAFAQVVDRLLESPRYGERWARHWLDVVRFAETNSYERDGTKPYAWRYRDYVIRSLNEDKPYDQFLREQVAGDELPQVTPDTIIATGFYRLGIWDDEPADRMQAKFDQLDDLVTTTSQAFLGLTVNCARCHDHKIDPIPQRDYYRLGAFFAGIRPMQSLGPNIETQFFKSPEDEADFKAKMLAHEQRQNVIREEMQQIEETLAKLYQSDHENAAAIEASKDIDSLEYRFYRDTWDKLPDFANLKPESVGTLDSGRFDLSPASRNTAIGFVFEGMLQVPQDGEYTFYLDSDDGSRLRINSAVVLEYDGIHGVGSPRQAKVKLPKGRQPITLEYFQRHNGLGLQVEWAGPGFARRLLSADDKRRSSSDAKQGNAKAALKNIREIMDRDGARLLGKEQRDHYAKLKKTLDELSRFKFPGDYALCVKEVGSFVPDTFVLERGSPLAPAAKVEPGFPVVLGGPPVELPKPSPSLKTSGRRLQLAHWLTSPDNKLTARVMANRVWQHHFGRGIVRSPNNFGNLGTPPTHPKLLDWLAGELIQSGWRLKALHRRIMLSSTYQMSSLGSKEALATDPGNDLFARFDMRRLSAEEVRDSVLAVDGQLNLEMYGPGIYPELSAEVLATQSIPGNGWGKSTPEQQARRSVYIHVKRSLISPLLSSFDFPDTDTSCEARFNTTQPGQALGMLNGKFLNDAAAVFAERLSREAGEDPAARVRLAVRLALCRTPRDEEIARAVRLIEQLQTKQGLSPTAAWNRYCLTMLNRNEFVYLD